MANYNQEREELHKTIWSIADDLRGAIGGWEFKAFVRCLPKNLDTFGQMV